LYGLRRARAGTVRLDGERLRIRSAADAVKAGMVLVPRDRRNDGLVLPMTVAENVTLATLHETSVAGLVSAGRQRASAEAQIGRLDIRPPNAAAVTRYLSGGNQQKVVLGRWLARKARAYLFDEPTVGVDVGAKSEIYALMHGLARDGAPVLVSSCDPAELVGVCDRILVMMRGRILTEVPTAGLTVDRLVAITTGAVKIGEGGDEG
ncbi:MAG: sugar ABC transporter ATP-binding protein, partial [Bauldia sp.]